MPAPSSIHQFLGEARVSYTVLPHRTAFTAQEEAAVMHVPGRDRAKVVICVADEKPIQAVLPAPLVVNLDRLLALAGAMPLFGPLCGQRVFVDTALAAEAEIVFSAGTQRGDSDTKRGLCGGGKADGRPVCRAPR